MKRILLLLSFLTATTVGMYADQKEALIVKLKNGSETAFFLKDKPQVTFEGTNLQVTSTAGNTTFALADILRFTYAKKDPTGINETVSEPTGVNFKDDVLTVSQLKAGATVSIYALDGKLIRQLAPKRYGTYRINLSELPAGLYLVKADDITYKIVKP